MTRISQEHREIAKYLRTAFGDPVTVTRFHQEGGQRHVDLIEARDRPNTGYCSYGTIGLSDYEIVFGDTALRVELLGMSKTGDTDFGNVLSSLVFEILDRGPACRPGAGYSGVLPQYALSDTLRQLLLVEPFPWESLTPLVTEAMEIHWLMVLPVSDEEATFANDHGLNALADLFTENEIDVCDLRRASVVRA